MNTSAIGTMMMPSITRTADSSKNVQYQLNGLLLMQKLAILQIFPLARCELQVEYWWTAVQQVRVQAAHL